MLYICFSSTEKAFDTEYFFLSLLTAQMKIWAVFSVTSQRLSDAAEPCRVFLHILQLGDICEVLCPSRSACPGGRPEGFIGLLLSVHQFCRESVAQALLPLFCLTFCFLYSRLITYFACYSIVFG